jgi:glycine/D-amino acid oxidase-like deaminating enzyme
VLEKGGSAAQHRAEHHGHPLQLSLRRKRGEFEHALKLWEGLSRALNYNVMYSARGVMMLAHSITDIQT